MKSQTASEIELLDAGAVIVEKRVILSMGGKGGVGKTSIMTALAE